MSEYVWQGLTGCVHWPEPAYSGGAMGPEDLCTLCQLPKTHKIHHAKQKNDNIGPEGKYGNPGEWEWGTQIETIWPPEEIEMYSVQMSAMKISQAHPANPSSTKGEKYQALIDRQKEIGLLKEVEAAGNKEHKDMLVPRIPAITAVADFYSLIIAQPMYMGPTVPENRRQVFLRAWERVTPSLARGFFDYIVLACTGEARHAYHGSDNLISNLPAGTITNRHHCYMWSMEYDPKSLLEALKVLYHEHYWHGAYGGKKWGKIADAGLMYSTIPDTVFIDHCVDLTHNDGCFLNKNVVFELDDTSLYLGLLDEKRNHTPEELYTHMIRHDIKVSYDVAPVWTRILNKDVELRTTGRWEYNPVTWGSKVFVPEFESSTGDPNAGVEESHEPDLEAAKPR